MADEALNGMAPPPRPLGRRTDATKDAWGSIRKAVAPLPKTFRGPTPPRSPGLRKYRNPRRESLWQIIGMCAGMGVTSMVETAERTPEPLLEGSPPLPGRAYSALWSYGSSRDYSRRQGIRFGNEEGAIVTHSLLAAREGGFALLADWPDDPANQRGLAGSRIDAAFAAKNAQIGRERRIFPVGDMALLSSFQEMLQLVGSGYTVAIGVQWPRSAMETGRDGAVRWDPRGPIEGGHCVELVDYDLSLDRVWIGNSWPQWGVGGIGSASLRMFAESFSPRAMSTGEAEAIVIRNVSEGDGSKPGEPWKPKVDWSGVW